MRTISSHIGLGPCSIRLAALPLAVFTALSCGGGGDGSASDKTPTEPGSTLTIAPVSSSNVILAPGASLLLHLVDGDGEPVSATPGAWQSSNPAVATVTGTGWITAVSEGKTTVSVDVQGTSVQREFTVDEANANTPRMVIYGGALEGEGGLYGPGPIEETVIAPYTGGDRTVLTVQLRGLPDEAVSGVERLGMLTALVPCSGRIGTCATIGNPRFTNTSGYISNAATSFDVCMTIYVESDVPFDTPVVPATGHGPWTLTYEDDNAGIYLRRDDINFLIYKKLTLWEDCDPA